MYIHTHTHIYIYIYIYIHIYNIYVYNYIYLYVADRRRCDTFWVCATTWVHKPGLVQGQKAVDSPLTSSMETSLPMPSGWPHTPTERIPRLVSSPLSKRSRLVPNGPGPNSFGSEGDWSLPGCAGEPCASPESPLTMSTCQREGSRSLDDNAFFFAEATSAPLRVGMTSPLATRRDGTGGRPRYSLGEQQCEVPAASAAQWSGGARGRARLRPADPQADLAGTRACLAAAASARVLWHRPDHHGAAPWGAVRG